ncbi:hypothetical protein [Mesorhizobium sp.]|uniref:hypothetical protein n=1 Tax=Mesorhizobium sp. TaxID=1871066 RepID=UPI00257A58D7|nr:hypothetical protein [Mesorhizobium sp.]
MFDIKKVEEEARKEMAEEKAKAAKSKIKTSLVKIEQARTILRNLEEEHQVLLRDIGA